MARYFVSKKIANDEGKMYDAIRTLKIGQTMNDEKNIEDLYRRYLESTLAKQAGKELSQVLRQIGLYREGQALEEYFEQAASFADIIQGSDWNGRRCFISSHVPSQAKRGDIWFDIVEIIPMILVPFSDEPSDDHSRWISLHPVYVWQFKTFLHLAKIQIVQKYFMKATDLFGTNPFDSMSSMSFVTNVYHEEAVTYAHWFGKYLCGQFELQLAKIALQSEEFLKLLPPGILIWDETQYDHSEFVRIAIGPNNLYKEPDDELDYRDNGRNRFLLDRILYEEWERVSNVGLLTLVPSELGLQKEIPRMGYEFVKLQNVAPRP